MSKPPAGSGDPIVQRLRALAQESPDLAEAARVYEVILPLLRDADVRVTPIVLTPEQARAKLERGVPLLHDVDLELDTQAAGSLMLQLACALETGGRNKMPRRRGTPLHATAPAAEAVLPRATAAGRIRRALEARKLDLATLLPRVAAGDRGFVTSLAQDLQLDPELVWTLARNTLRPALRAWRRQLAALAELFPWRKGYCHTCGAAATLAELQENNQVKHLRCGQCGADWPFNQLQCMYCGNEDHKTLSYLYPEHRHETMRVEVCDRCKGYLKVIAAFSPTPPESLAVEDLATLHLDFIAQEHGYARVSIE